MIWFIMAIKTFLRIQFIVSPAIDMSVMAGSAIHLAKNIAFASFKKPYLVAMNIQMFGINNFRKFRQLEFCKCVAGFKFKSRSDHETWRPGMADRAHIHPLAP